jgi:hypothetical protein
VTRLSQYELPRPRRPVEHDIQGGLLVATARRVETSPRGPALTSGMPARPQRGSHHGMKRLSALSATWLVPLVLLAGCHEKPLELGPPDAVYHVRGQVVAIEGTGDDATLSVSHEAIPGFADRDGKPATMPAMTMIFALGPALDRGALQPNSQWELTFEVRWKQPPTLRIVAAKPLPAGSALALAPEPH